ncbi:MAG TPA: thiamine pyrophosphate-binding protein [Polyangiaceae bacterium]
MAPEATDVQSLFDDVDDDDRVSFVRDLAGIGADVVPPKIPRLAPLGIEDDIPSSRPLVRSADSIVAALVEMGVDTFFGIPGGPVSPIFDAILNCVGARLIESRHETGAAFAAAGYFRASGRVPCVVVTAGPGATNVVTGVVSAHLERVPMLVISGDVAWAAEGGRLLQNSGPEGIDIEGMLRGVTRAAIRVEQAQSAGAFALAALRAATNPDCPGPALLVVPIHRAAQSAASPRVVSTNAAARVEPDPGIVTQICRKLVSAKRPLLVVGAGVRAHAGTLRRLMDVFNVPIITTPRAKGIISERHPRSLRHGGLAASMWAREYCSRGVDVALVLGTDLDDCSLGQTRYVAENGELIHVDIDSRVFNRNLPTSLGVVADIGCFLECMRASVIQDGLRHANIDHELRQIRGTSPFDEPGFATDSSTIITPARALADLEQSAGSDARFVTDIGEHMLFALHYLTANGPNQFVIHLGLGSMGSGVCSAVGLALGQPETPVICICGDGSMQMAGMEVLVALKERLHVLFAVFNDARYNMVYHGFRQVFGREAPFDSPWIDFAGWARALQVPSARINHPGEITPNLVQALLHNGPAVLDIRIDRHQRVKGGGRNESLQRMACLSERQTPTSSEGGA